ncbi:MAG: hypothetical protein WD771_00250, partial [Gemmatimonadaceae bacterium]
PPPPTGGPGGPGGLGAAPVNVRRTDIAAAARAEVRAVRAIAQANAAATTVPIHRAHWLDLADRAGRILDPSR